MFESAMKIKTTVLRVLVLAGTGLGMAAGAGATPVTLAFEAEISSASLGIPFDSGIDFSVGDKISGQFTFNPLEDCAEFEGPGQPLGGLCATTQPFSFSVEIDGATFRTSNYELEVRDNIPIQDFPSASVIDTIKSYGGGLSPIDSSRVPNIDPTLSGFSVFLWGRSNSLTAATVPESAEAWNRFNLRRAIDVSLHDGLGHAVGFHATINRFSVVPEPTTLCLVALVSLGMLPQRTILSNRRA